MHDFKTILGKQEQEGIADEAKKQWNLLEKKITFSFAYFCRHLGEIQALLYSHLTKKPFYDSI